MIHRHNQIKYGIILPFGTKIGGGLLFPHYGSIVINPSANIGENFTMYQCCTIGSVRGPKGGVPIIGDNVVLSVGASIIGKVSVGNNVMIGTNAVVTRDIPEGTVAVGIPAKVINSNGASLVRLE